jgi:UDP-hydrolysing UDP-N-acetyl-D-glucosamine 2-epimerase
VGVLTTSRADLGVYLPVMDALRESPALELRVIAGGSHVDERYGGTEWEIEREGHQVFRRIRCFADDMGSSIALSASEMAGLLHDWRPDVLLVLGDRFEMLACALATAGFRLPLAHIHGGELSEGALDDSFRHALTKLSHLHFPATEDAERRLRQLGEEAWRITRSGAPALDRMATLEPEDMDLPERFLLVTYHPVTQEPGQEGAQTASLLAALDSTGLPCVVTAPNADPGRDAIEAALREFCERRPDSRYVVSAGARGYFTLMRRAAAMVGNSSSGIIEAASFELPVVNVGTRQDGRTRAPNVIDSGSPEGEIQAALERALSSEFRQSLAGSPNPYGDGRASERIVSRLEALEIDDRLMRKRFVDIG